MPIIIFHALTKNTLYKGDLCTVDSVFMWAVTGSILESYGNKVRVEFFQFKLIINDQLLCDSESIKLSVYMCLKGIIFKKNFDIFSIGWGRTKNCDDAKSIPNVRHSKNGNHRNN